MASQIEILKQNLLELLNILRFLSISQLQMIVNFDRREESVNPEEVYKIIQNCDTFQLETLLKLSQQANTELPNLKNSIEDNFIKSLSIQQIGVIGFVYRTYLLQEMIQKNLSIDLLMKIVEITPYKGYPDHQLKFLHQFQQLLGNLMPSTLSSLHEDVRNGDGEELLELLEDNQDQYLLYQPLRSLLQLDFEDVSQFYESFPKFRSQQLVQLVRLMQLDPLNILEIRQLLSPKGWMGLQSLIEDDIEVEEMNKSNLNPFVSLVILEQPSDQTVYKRNLKPFPTVMVTGDERKVLAHDECLVVVPVLYRCDNLTPVAKLTGDAPIKVTSGNTAKFKKLKIMITSRQLADTLFCLRFELRKQKIGARNTNNNNEQYETLTFVQSNPISVVSHSTLMKKTPPSVQPTISEIIPANGSSSGGNKVVIIGSNFVDSPVLRVRFDNTDVTPDFHGSGTLICTAPQHIPGPVSVSVSNDAKTWSETTATYIYQDNLYPNANSSVVAEEFDCARSNYTLEKSIFDSVTKLDQSFFRNMSNHVVPDFNFVDARGFTPLHYVAVTGDVAVAHFFLTNNADINARDPNGNTPLHWAVLSGNVNLIPLFAYFGSPLNVPNFKGETPLHLAISSQQLNVVDYLIKCGANVNSLALNGETPLHYASVLQENFVSLLIQNGAFVNYVDSEGESPLHWATRECNFPTINLLLQHHSFPNLQNEDGESPLHLAISSEDSFFIQHLLNLSKFDLNLKDSVGVSPIQIALESGLFTISEQLVKHGALPPHIPSLSFTSVPAESLTYLFKQLNLNPSSSSTTTAPNNTSSPQPFGASHCTVPTTISV